MTVSGDHDDRPRDVDPTTTNRFAHLPEPISPEDMIATQEAESAPDPTMGRDPDRDFMLRYAGP